MIGCSIADLFDLVDQLPEVTRSDNGRYWRIAVSSQVERDELAELTFEAWRLTAPPALIDRRGDRLPQ